VNSVQVGQDIQGQVHLVNQTGAARQVRLQLTVDHALAAITSPAGGLITAGPGSSSTVPFTVTFGNDSPTGSAWLDVKAADAANPAVVYSDVPMNLNVTKPPGFIAKYLWAIIGLAALAFLAVLAWFLLRAAHRRKVNVQGLVAILRRNGEQAGAELRAPGKWSDTFRFIIRDEDQQSARLDYPQPGFSPYTVRRAGNGELRLVTPAGDRHDVVIGGPGEPLEQSGLELAFRDTSRRRAPRRPAGGRRGPDPRKQKQQQQQQQQQQEQRQPAPDPVDYTETITPAQQDEWL
jgi:hypothetical protein